MPHTGRLAERVTVTMPVDLIAGIDRVERNRSRFIAETVRNELQRRQRLELMRSLEAPHPETTCSIPPQASPSGGLQRRAGRREIDEPFSRHIVTRRSGAHPRS